MMTVNDLIKILHKYDPEDIVILCTHDEDYVIKSHSEDSMGHVLMEIFPS